MLTAEEARKLGYIHKSGTAGFGGLWWHEKSRTSSSHLYLNIYAATCRFTNFTDRGTQVKEVASKAAVAAITVTWVLTGGINDT